MGKTDVKVVLLKNFSNYSEAMMIKELLEKQGIKSMIQKGDLNAASEFTGWTGDANIFVPENKFEEAKSIIDAYCNEK
jgi:hypothetical protein